MWGADYLNLLVARRDVIQCLKLTEELILVVRVLHDKLDKINVALHHAHEEIITLLETAPHIVLLEIHGANPCLKHGAEDAEIVPAIADLLHVPTENQPGAHPDVFGQLTELLIVHYTGEDAGQKALTLSRITLRKIRGDDQAEYTVSEKLELFIVAGAEGQAIIGAGRNGHLFSVFRLFLP